MIQAVTDIINLILLNKGCKSYLNNFTIKMRAPLTQEELNYRANFTDRVNAISNVNSLFADVEDKAKRLTILKSLISSLDLGDVVSSEIQKEIDSAVAEAEKAAAAETETTGAGVTGGEAGGVEETGGDMDLVPMESFNAHDGSLLLENDTLGLDEEIDLPNPEEADSSKDFTYND